MVLENKLASSEGVRQPLFRSASEITGICVVIITTLYLALVYLLFFKFKLLPWNKVSQGLVLLIGIIILTGFLVGLQGLTPSSVQATITGRIVEIEPQVSGRVTVVTVEPNVTIVAGDTLYGQSK